MSATYRHDYRAFGEFLRGPEMLAMVLDRAEKAKTVAEGIAPVDKKSPHAGRYKRSFKATAEVGRSADGTHRAIGTLSNDAPEAIFVEQGTENNAAHHTLRKAISS